MAFPVVESTNTSSQTSSTTHTVSLPTGITSGDVLLIFAYINQNPTITKPSGWTEVSLNTGAACYGSVFYKIASGSEGSTTTFSTSVAEVSCHSSFRISGSTGEVEVAQNFDDGLGDQTTTNWEVPSLTVSWGSDDNLWLASIANDDASDYTTGSTIPTGYGNEVSTTVVDGAVGVLRKEVATDSEGVYTWNTVASTRAVTSMVAVRPSQTTDYPLTALVGAFTLTGIDTALTSARSIVASVGIFALTGFAAFLSKGFGLIASLGTFTLTGNDTFFSQAKTLVASVGTFTLTGIAAGFKTARMLATTVGAFVLTGIDVMLRSPIVWTNNTKNTSTWSNGAKNSSTWENDSKSNT